MTSRLVETFEAWGYHEVATPAVEYFDVIAQGLSELARRRSVRFIEPGTGEVVMLRADVTPQIARMVSQRHDVDLPDDRAVRLCYASVVVRQPEGPRDNIEQHQAGVELVGDGSPAADAEVIALCHEALSALGLEGVTIELADVGLTRALLTATGLSESGQVELRRLIARKDARGVARIVEGRGIDPALGRTLGAVCHLYGGVDVLKRARAVLDGGPAGAVLDRLACVASALESDAPSAFECLNFDLGETRGFDYYTGLRVRVWAEGSSDPVVRGGRYDDLLGRYGEPRPATGFAVDLDALENALQTAGVEPAGSEPRPAVLVVISDSEPTPQARRVATARARAIRASGARAWVHAGLQEASALQAAEEAAAAAVVIVGPNGDITQRRRESDRWVDGPFGSTGEDAPAQNAKGKP